MPALPAGGGASLNSGALFGRRGELAQLLFDLFERLLTLADGVEGERAVVADGAEAFEGQLGLGLAGVAAGDGLDELEACVHLARVLVGLAPDALQTLAVFPQVLLHLRAPLCLEPRETLQAS